MTRVYGWDTRLVAFEREVLGEPFRWGKTDCGSLVRGVWTALYGEDAPSPEVRDYDTRFGALRAHVESGGIEAALREHGAREVDLRYAQGGDVVVEPPSDEEPMGGAGVVVASSRALFCPAGDVVQKARLRDLRAEDDGTLTTLRMP